MKLPRFFLGCDDVGDRVVNARELLAGGVAARGDGGLDTLPGHAQLAGDGGDGAGVDARPLTLAQTEHGPGAHTKLATPLGEPIGVQDVAQQVVEGFAGARSHAES